MTELQREQQSRSGKTSHFAIVSHRHILNDRNGKPTEPTSVHDEVSSPALRQTVITTNWRTEKRENKSLYQATFHEDIENQEVSCLYRSLATVCILNSETILPNCFQIFH